VRDFVTAVQERMTGYIRKTEQSEDKRMPQFQDSPSNESRNRRNLAVELRGFSKSYRHS